MLEKYSQIIIPVVVAALMSMPGIIALYMQRRKERAEAIQKESSAAGEITDAALSLIEPYKQRIADMQAELDRHEIRITELVGCKRKINDLQEELRIWQDGVMILLKQLRHMEITPAWQPKGHKETKDDASNVDKR